LTGFDKLPYNQFEMWHFRLILVIAGIFWICSQTWASQNEYFKAQLDRNVVNLGDSLVYTIEVMTAGETQFSPDITPPNLSKYFQVGETFSRSSVNILNGKTYIVTFKEVHLIANRTGKIHIEPAQIELIDSTTNQRVMRYTNSIALVVNEANGAFALPTPTPEIDVLRPIKKSAKLSLSQWLPFAIGIGIIMTMFAVMFYLKHRPVPEPPAPEEPVDPRSPEERAFDALEEAMKLKIEGKIDEFYTTLSAILRRYMAEAFAFKAEEATTREMLSEMERLEFKPDFLEKYREYFLECDQVKFANVKPDQQKVEAALPRVKALINHPDKRNTPAPVPEPEPTTPVTESSESTKPDETT